MKIKNALTVFFLITMAACQTTKTATPFQSSGNLPRLEAEAKRENVPTVAPIFGWDAMTTVNALEGEIKELKAAK